MSTAHRVTTTNGTATVTLPQDPMSVDWVELGCRGWAIDESGAELIEPHPVQGPHAAHLDLTTLNILMFGDGAFLRRAYDDLVAAGVYGLRDHWRITTYPPTGSAMQWVTI